MKTRVPKLKMGDTELRFSDTMQYLGLTMQKRLTWTTHIKNQIKKVNQIAGSVRRVIG